PAVPPVDSADVLCPASVDTLCVIVSSTVAVRHQAQSSKSAPATPTALPNVPHHESLSCARADHDWIRLAPDAGSPTSFRHLPGLHTSVSSIVPALPRPASTIGPWIPSPLPRLAARPATPTAAAVALGCYRTTAVQIGIRRCFRRQPQLRPASDYV